MYVINSTKIIFKFYLFFCYYNENVYTYIMFIFYSKLVTFNRIKYIK